MKQHITLKQLQEINAEQTHNLLDCIPILSSNNIREPYSITEKEYLTMPEKITIGYMIEALVENSTVYSSDMVVQIHVARDAMISDIYRSFYDQEDGIPDYSATELCDVLWYALKSIL